jgi:hypothetical protein
MDAATTLERGMEVVKDQQRSIPWYAADVEVTLCQQLQLPTPTMHRPTD